MSDTTVGRVTATAPELADVAQETLQLHVDDAVAEVARLGITGAVQERAQRYLAAHLATLSVRRPVSERLGDYSASYGDGSGSGLDATSYGQEFKRLLRSARAGESIKVI